MRRFLQLFLLLIVALASISCRAGKSAVRRDFETASVRRDQIDLIASATGVLEPIRLVEVKSKSSGEIVELPVETGDYVRQGAVLARLYPRDAQNQYAQTKADVEAAQARLLTAQSEFQRAESLRRAQLLPDSDYDIKRLEVVNAQAQLVRARTAMEIAAERLRETTVIAPVSGRIIEKQVELGNVVSSAVSQVSGGTTLMKMADLREVQIRALVDETDIGKVSPGQTVRTKVDAFPGRQFQGVIAKIEPKAIVDQNVTMFPVLVRIPNDEEVLKPGMNAEVDIYISTHPNVLVVPNEALKSPRDAVGAATAVGLTADEVRSALGMEGGGPGGGPPRGAGGGARAGAAAGSEAPPQMGGGGQQRGTGGGRGPRGAGGGGQRGMGGGGRAQRGTGPQPAIVFKLVDGKAVPTKVMTGVSNWEVTEVVSGLKEGDTVIVLPSASLLRQQEEFRNRMRGMSGVPGMGGGGAGGGGRRP